MSKMIDAGAQVDMAEVVSQRIALLHEVVPNSIGDMLNFRLINCDPAAGIYVLGCKTETWMRNVAGTLHGGMCATVVDQAMGFISYCIKPGEGTAPTVQMQVTYHRPLIPGEEVLVTVKVLTVTRSLMHLSAEAVMAYATDKLCLTSSATYFYKPAK